ncbi:MAG TPA: toll/interleukin-1 receptor domain-containing protein, partial [Thermoanaerobaculia bacterium]
MSQPREQIVLSYAHEDFEDAVRVYRALTESGLDVWFDRVSLLPGQNWRLAISDAIRRARCFVALLSSRSVEKRGFVQAETRKALDVLLEIPPGDSYIIPVRLDPCSPQHEVLHDLQWVNLYEDWGFGLKRIRDYLLARRSENTPLQPPPSFLLPPVLRFDGLYLDSHYPALDSPALRFFPNGSVVLKGSPGLGVRYEDLSLARAGRGSTIMKYQVEQETIAFGERALLQNEYHGLIQEEAIDFHEIFRPAISLSHGSVYVFKPYV